ncbi:aspartate aminotransferase family protein [Anaerosinus massiliensis]|uniref:aspartate aminotransferase family protein n=1 Tax=Massilibacillus massiliensis TaxID=1806837 RepID=UPI000AB0F306|nr:aspartate aminotransferase family protein [Massilibacillus massiliensis]
MSKDELTQLTLKRYEENVNPAIAKLFKIMGLATIECYSKGIYVFDTKGNRYIDCLGGYGVFSLGHRNEAIIEAVKRQLDYIPLSSKIFLNDKLAELSSLLAEILPKGLKYSFFVNSGTEAVEGALKLARLHTEKTKIISMRNAFHGKTFGSLTATGRDLFRDPFKPLLPDFVHVDFGDIAAAEREIDHNTAAIIIEPIQGEGGIIVPPQEYIPALRNLCDEKNILLICDEIQTGLGRTGQMFAVDAHQVIPDIMIVAKALGGGVMPIGAFCAKEEIWSKYIESPFLHTSTFGGNQLACVAAIETIKILKKEYFTYEVAEKGAYFMRKLNTLKEEYPKVIQEVRGRGLMIGIEMTEEGLGGFIMAECIKQHIMVAYTLNNPKVIRFEPPFIISYEIIDDISEILHDIVKQASQLTDEF